MIKLSFKYGLMGALIVLLYTQILHRSQILFSDKIGAILGYLAIVIMPICTFLAIREFSNRYTGKNPKIGYAILVGAITSVIASIIFSSGTRALDAILGGSYQETLIQRTTVSMQENGNSPEEIQTRIMAIKAFYGSWKPVLNNLTWYVSLGFIYSIGSFVILKLNYTLKKQV